MGLREYKAKRDFHRTHEPAGKVHPASGTKHVSFVVQKHEATRLHYDFRLEMEGVLKSWAVPKGFPTRRGDRRLAVEVEDHPLEYGRFEGTIPEGNYGAGTVMVWDRGTYEVSGGNPEAALRAGKLHLVLRGTKLKGEWALVRMRRTQGDKPQWLLLKSGEDVRAFSAQEETRSVVTRRSLEEIARKERKEWVSHRPADRKSKQESSQPRSRRLSARAEPRSKGRKRGEFAPDIEALPQAEPEFVPPMKALSSTTLPRGADWVYEIKFDGVRALAIKSGKTVRLISRNEKDLTPKYPEIVDAVKTIPIKKGVLDGEVVALDETGRSSFQLLQSWHLAGAKKPPLVYYVFDMLNLEGTDVRSLPLWRRKKMAQAAAGSGVPEVRFSAGIDAPADRLIGEMKARGLEGLIAKQKNSNYQAGRRSGAWVKYKWTSEQEFVIGGYTPPQGARSHFGALLVGYYDGPRLIYAGKVGTGFDEAGLALLHRRFQKLITPACPFANLPENRPGAYGRGMTAGQMRRCTWLRPELVCQVRFSEWTRDNLLRQPAFLGLREDKNASEVVRE